MNPKFKLPIYFALMMAIVALVSSPFWLWQLKSSQELNVLILDKTVPDYTYREHKGLSWILNQNKYVQKDGTVYDFTEDYVGFHPKEKEKFTIKSLPDNFSHELLYIADGYGVYQDEFFGENVQGARSKSLYGGMTVEDVNFIKESTVKNGTPLIVEFNTFANPTEPEVRNSFYEILNLNWSGWIGRYFHDLTSEEVPVWVRSNYESQTGEKWSFTGNGLVLANEQDYIIVIDQKGLKNEGVTYRLTESGENHLKGKREILYQYWFDIVEAEKEEEVLATYTLPVNREGKKQLEEFAIPTTFPAIIHHQNASYESYYFAGDYADQAEVPSLYQTVGLKKWRQWFTPGSEGSTAEFYWKVYVPMMDDILNRLRHHESKEEVKNSIEIEIENGISMSSKAGSDYLQVRKDGKWEDILIKGVNIGIAKPGSFPGETSITKQEYMNWFKQIGEMNANAIRIYTIHPPGFYEALYEYNQSAKQPLYLFHGVWLNEEVFYSTMDAFSNENVKEFKEEITRVIDLLHGNETIPKKTGHASGSYLYDLSPYVLGYMLGVEWNPEVVKATNDKHQNLADFKGKYIYSEGANPFEIWLAQMMDFTVEYEATTYNWQHPMSFTNWVTTDLLDHPIEPDETEDMVSINPNVFFSTEKVKTGLFGSYHIYPYYPEFLNLDKKYTEYVDHRGQKNNYAGYLNDMKKAHQMPVLVAEFGVPSSRGITHKNINGYDQGHHSEEEQGLMISQLFEDIVNEKMAGGLVFIWQDEWFKRTWNTMDYDNPNRRPFWSNIQTSEQNFGLLSFDPGKEGFSIKVDGQKEDWDEKSVKLYENKDSNEVTGVYMQHDERYVYFRLDSNNDLNKTNTYLLLNTIGNQGQASIPNVEKLQAKGIDFVAQLNGTDTSEIVVDSKYDTFYYHYHDVLKMIPEEKDTVYHPIRLALNKGFNYTNEAGITMTSPFDSFVTGHLQVGNANTKSDDYNSLADYFISQDGKTLELRIPWMLLNFKDPSQHEIMGGFYTDPKGLKSSFKTEGIRVGLVQTDKAHNVLQSYPSASSLSDDQAFELYEWNKWDLPTYKERLKQSYYILKESFETIK